jgi:thioredoxin reductase (NADPH)
LLLIDGGYAVTADAVIAANGMEWRRLEVEGVEGLLDRGVYYGAGRSEAARCGGDPVVVVGAGNSAGQAVLHLARAGARVTMIVRGDQLGSRMSAYLVERIEPNPLIDVRLQTNVTAVHADGDQLGAVTISDGAGKGEQLRASALFLCIGGTPRTAWAGGAGVRVNQAGFILTGSSLLESGRRPEGWPLDRDPLVLETTVPGLFAAGDLRSGSTKRVAAAVGEGAMAAALVHRRLEELAGGH